MGDFADDVQTRLKEQLQNNYPIYSWENEYHISGTPVDVAGRNESQLVVIELEWRRADPADNTAKLFRHLQTGEITAEQVTVFQLFTNYYDLVRGGVKSKRKNAEFVGKIASEALEELAYHPLDFDIDPPKSGEKRPTDWETRTNAMASKIQDSIEQT